MATFHIGMFGDCSNPVVKLLLLGKEIQILNNPIKFKFHMFVSMNCSRNEHLTKSSKISGAIYQWTQWIQIHPIIVKRLFDDDLLSARGKAPRVVATTKSGDL